MQNNENHPNRRRIRNFFREKGYYIVLGLICGLMSYYFTQINSKIGQLFARIKSMYRRWIAGGLIIGVLIFLFPPLYGEGYDTIELLLNGTSNAEWDTVMNNSFFYGHGQLLLLYLILIIKNILNFRVIYGKYFISGSDLQFLCNTARFYCFYNMFFFLHLIHLTNFLLSHCTRNSLTCH